MFIFCLLHISFLIKSKRNTGKLFTKYIRAKTCVHFLCSPSFYHFFFKTSSRTEKFLCSKNKKNVKNQRKNGSKSGNKKKSTRTIKIYVLNRQTNKKKRARTLGSFLPEICHFAPKFPDVRYYANPKINMPNLPSVMA